MRGIIFAARVTDTATVVRVMEAVDAECSLDGFSIDLKGDGEGAVIRVGRDAIQRRANAQAATADSVVCGALQPAVVDPACLVRKLRHLLLAAGGTEDVLPATSEHALLSHGVT